jgi:6-pyruvoyltetrahydropterin/6-carboxytetrahydropterin synthase
MATLLLRRRVAFSAGHAYWLKSHTDEENHRLFGPWASYFGHGHNYVVEAGVAGDVAADTGMVVNITAVDAALKSVIGPLANRHLTHEVPHFFDTPPTLENIVLYVTDRFQAGFIHPEARLDRMTVWESPTLWATLVRKDGDDLVTLTRAFDFAAAHRLHAPGLSDRDNREIFGKCNNPHGHGHNYGIEVTVGGEPDPVTGMLVDLDALDTVLEREVVARYDHKHLNDDTPDFAMVNPTSENLTLAIWNHLKNAIPAPARLVRVVVRETERNYFEYCGD